VGLQDAEDLPRVGRAGEGTDLDGRVTQEESQQLATGVPTGSRDCDPYLRHVHDYTYFRIVMHLGFHPVTMSVARTTVLP
jgi:hypothetical protein